jgi:hypothetical protein
MAAPKSPEASAVQTRIYALEVAKEDADKTKQQLEGDWIAQSGAHYGITIDRNKIEIKQQSDFKTETSDNNGTWTVVNEGGYVFHGVKKGSSIEGTLSVPALAWDRLSPFRQVYWHYRTPSEIVPFSGTIAHDGSNIELLATTTVYTVSRWDQKGGIFDIKDDTGVVTATGKNDMTAKLTRP